MKTDAFGSKPPGQTSKGHRSLAGDTMTSSLFSDKVAVVTGGASGLGRALCEDLAERGARLIVADIDLEQATDVAHALNTRGVAASPIHVDVSDPAAVGRLVHDTLEKEGRIDYMFNNAGVPLTGKFAEMTLEDIQRVVAINLQGVLYGSWAAYPVMIGQGSGHIVNTASLYGLVPKARQSVYSATKHGIVSFSTSLNREARPRGVKVSVVCPGLIRTRMFPVRAAEDGAMTVSRGILGARWCARSILKSVAKGKVVIIPPFYNSLLWRVVKASPFPLLTARVLDRWFRRLGS